MLQGRSFGIPLDEFVVLLDQKESDVPFVLEQCCCFIYQNGTDPWVDTGR